MLGLPDGLMLTEGGPDDVAPAAAVLDPESSDPRAFLERVLAQADRRFLVLKEDQAVVGVGCLHEEGARTSVHAVAIRPDRQGRGWGRALVSTLVHLAQGSELVIEVDSTNAKAERLYRSLGFRDRDVTDYYELAR
jgi:ribosomal-protein-alanine N-acetyltransferase